MSKTGLKPIALLNFNGKPCLNLDSPLHSCLLEYILSIYAFLSSESNSKDEYKGYSYKLSQLVFPQCFLLCYYYIYINISFYDFT